ncbi:hypothetical protein CC78DRAFT_599658 [Lojkania enalia]|uniref:Uncharacterized protein n=1 Tax=Lojkania enalia TaxID=147567 RepID=A0A9P4TQQ1_9PLEO|nr:hypothetical protein CC78DRAFT_599658 [Didymosphaeria enalia]
MIIFFLIGLAMSLAHCIFYPKLRNVIVGDPSAQEEKLRFGTAFSFLAQICLGASVWTSYTQWLWRTVSKTELSVGALNAAFGADSSVLALINIELFKKLRIGSIMALFAWSLLLPPFFTPATLFIVPSQQTNEVNALMPYPSIADSTVGHKFAYSPPLEYGTTEHGDDGDRIFTGPRTILNLIATATASLGEILDIDSPYNNSIYSIQFFGPIIKCLPANTSQTSQISRLLAEEMSIKLNGSIETDNVYYSFVPEYKSNGELIANPQPREQSPSNATNQLWMTFLRTTYNSSGARVKERHYQVCRLHNATYDLNITRDHGFQNIAGSYDLREEVPFPSDVPGSESNMAQHAYSAFMWALADQLVGKFSWYVQPNNDSTSALPSQFGVIESPIARTSLLGSWDLDTFFDLDEEKGLYKVPGGPNLTLSDQRLQDKALAKNRTLDVLIEELSFNTTVSLMHNELLLHEAMSKVFVTEDVNRYSYKAPGLFIPYALAVVFTFICVVLGLYSFVHDDVFPDKKFQDIVVAAEDPEIIQLVKYRKRSMSVVVVGDKVIWRAGSEKRQKEAWMLWKKIWGRKRRGLKEKKRVKKEIV